MGTIVQKYGGSSVSTPEKLCQVARRVVETQRQGHQVVVVVSAMGDTTNKLLKLAHEVSPEPERRELDMLLTVGERISMSLLSMAIQDLGAPAVSFTGSQSGIITTHNHTNAKIIKVIPTRVLNALAQDKVVIIAGFQGVSERLEITSLGRGGSDTTAVAMAAALNADYVEICSDVDGVYSADPRVTPSARKLDELSYDEMQTLSDSGAKVLNAEAVEWAKRSEIEVRCVATATPSDGAQRGTSIRAMIADPERGHTHSQLSAVTHHPGLIRASGRGRISAELIDVLSRYGCADAALYQHHNTHLMTSKLDSQLDVRSSETSSMNQRESCVWEVWIPLLNLYGEELLSRELAERGASSVEHHWSWLTLVGRGLLTNAQSPKKEETLSLIERVERLLDEVSIKSSLHEATPAMLRWAVKLDDAPRAVKLIHDALILS